MTFYYMQALICEVNFVLFVIKYKGKLLKIRGFVDGGFKI